MCCNRSIEGRFNCGIPIFKWKRHQHRLKGVIHWKECHQFYTTCSTVQMHALQITPTVQSTLFYSTLLYFTLIYFYSISSDLLYITSTSTYLTPFFFSCSSHTLHSLKPSTVIHFMFSYFRLLPVLCSLSLFLLCLLRNFFSSFTKSLITTISHRIHST